MFLYCFVRGFKSMQQNVVDSFPSFSAQVDTGTGTLALFKKYLPLLLLKLHGPKYISLTICTKESQN